MNDNKLQTLSSITSWILFLLFLVVLVNMGEVPTVPTESPERLLLRNFHIAMGSLLFLCSFFRAALWLIHPPQNNNSKLPDASYAQVHVLQFSLYCTFIAQGISGILNAWWDGLIQFVPGVDTINHGLWVTVGYLHSAFGFFYINLILFILLFRIYHMIRYRAFSLNVFA
jgi:cytochrome b561